MTSARTRTTPIVRPKRFIVSSIETFAKIASIIAESGH
jgi:hypothetical protein